MKRKPDALNSYEIEAIEKLSMRATTQALLNFATNACDEFRNSPDDADGVAEDVTQEALRDLSGFPIRQRRYGTVDYRQARYVFLPEYMLRQALFVDSKAEKSASIAKSKTIDPLFGVRKPCLRTRQHGCRSPKAQWFRPPL